MKNILEDLSLQFSGRIWGANGPLQVSRAMRSVCGGERWVGEETRLECGDVTVFRQETNRIFSLFNFISLFGKDNKSLINKIYVCLISSQKHFYPINWRTWFWLFNVSSSID